MICAPRAARDAATTAPMPDVPPWDHHSAGVLLSLLMISSRVGEGVEDKGMRGEHTVIMMIFEWRRRSERFTAPPK